MPQPDHIDTWAEESWTFYQGREVQYDEPHIYVDYCEFIDGVHTYPGYYCTHEEEN